MLDVTSRIVPAFQTALVVDTVTQLTALLQNAQTAFQGGWARLVMTPAFTAAPKMAFASAALATRGADAKVSAPGMANVSTTNANAARNQVTLI